MTRPLGLDGRASRARLVGVIGVFCLLVAVPAALAAWMKINTNDGMTSENLGAPLYTSTCSDPNLANYLEIKNAWAVNDGGGTAGGFYYRVEACAQPAAGTESQTLRIGAGLDCNNDGDVADPYVAGPDGDRKVVYWPNADQVWLYSGTNQQIIQMPDGTYGERVSTFYDWWIPLDKLPPACRASAAPIGLALATAKIVGGSPVTQDETPLVPWNHKIDYGDANNPDPMNGTCTEYPTRIGCSGARHGLGSPLMLGASVDGDGGNNYSPAADADDASGVADEDGLATTPGVNWVSGGNASMNATVSGGSGYLNCWMDWNNDKDWADANERVIADASLLAGLATQTFAMPGGITFPATFITRCRLSPGANQGTTVTGAVEFGEVEDYQWAFGAAGNRPAAVTVAAGVNGANVHLNWTNIASNESYLVLSSAQPYFRPGDAGVTTTADPDNSSPFDVPGIGGAADVQFYAIEGQVTTSTPDLTSALSNRTGLFEFTLLAGN